MVHNLTFIVCCAYGDSVRFFIFLEGITISTKELQINDEIRVPEVRVVGPEGEQMGIMKIDDAKNYAYNNNLDLVLIAPTAQPPVCRAMDYGKFRFERMKKEKEAKKKQQIVKVKEVQLSCRIDKHDFDTRVRNTTRFLQEGNKVRVVIRFKGREMSHMEIGRDVMEQFEAACAEFGTAEKKATIEGRNMSLVLAPVKNSK